MRTGTGKPKLRLRAIVIAGLLSVGLVGALLAQTVQKVSPVLVFTCSAGSFASALAGTGIFTCTAAPSYLVRHEYFRDCHRDSHDPVGYYLYPGCCRLWHNS
jgi:hypothetical protein